MEVFRILKLFSLFLFALSCHDNRKNEDILTEEASKYTLPPKHEGFDDLYCQPGAAISFLQDNRVSSDRAFQIPTQSIYWRNGGKIEIPGDGIIEVSGRIHRPMIETADYAKLSRSLSIQVYLNENEITTISKAPSGVHNDYHRPFDWYDGFQYADFKNIEIPVKKGQLLSFRQMHDHYELAMARFLYLSDLIVYFKRNRPKDDKKTGEDTSGPVPFPAGSSGSQ